MANFISEMYGNAIDYRYIFNNKVEIKNTGSSSITVTYADYGINGDNLGNHAKSLIIDGNKVYINEIGGGVSGNIQGTSAIEYNNNILNKLFSIDKLNIQDRFFNDFLKTKGMAELVKFTKSIFSGDDTIIGGYGDQEIYAGDGKNVIFPGAGDDTIFGDKNYDTVEYDVNWSQTAISKGTGGFEWVIEGASIGKDKLSMIDKIQFNDGAILYNHPVNAGLIQIAGSDDIYRLYQAAFDRTPDEGGFLYWLGVHAKGLPINSIAYSFRSSPEFASKYGANISNNDFVYTLYQNILNREPDFNGLKYWQEQLNLSHITKDNLLMYFASSPENVALTAHNVDTGFFVV